MSAVCLSLIVTISVIYSNQIYESLHFVISLNKFHKKNTASKLDLCPNTSQKLVGELVPYLNETNLDIFDEQFKNGFESGGYYKPADCISRDRIAILVPVRNRAEQIPIFLKNLQPMLMRQLIEYQIFFIHQARGYWFNRAALFNVGFIEALKFRQWDCFIFHDVDTIPIDDRNLYVCPRINPRHMGALIDKFDFKYVKVLIKCVILK